MLRQGYNANARRPCINLPLCRVCVCVCVCVCGAGGGLHEAQAAGGGGHVPAHRPVSAGDTADREQTRRGIPRSHGNCRAHRLDSTYSHICIIFFLCVLFEFCWLEFSKMRLYIELHVHRLRQCNCERS